jgi:hypothetical protein
LLTLTSLTALVGACFFSSVVPFATPVVFLSPAAVAVVLESFLSAGAVTVVFINPSFLASAWEITSVIPPALTLRARDFSMGSS